MAPLTNRDVPRTTKDRVEEDRNEGGVKSKDGGEVGQEGKPYPCMEKVVMVNTFTLSSSTPAFNALLHITRKKYITI